MKPKTKKGPRIVIGIVIGVVLIICIFLLAHSSEKPSSRIPLLTHHTYLPVVSNNYSSNKWGISQTSDRCIAEGFDVRYVRYWWPDGQLDCAPGVVHIQCVCYVEQAQAVLAGQRQIIAPPGSTILAANEPERDEQAHTSPDEWAYYQHELRVKFPQYKWASPAITDDITWLTRFVTVYQNMYPGEFPFSVLDFHCYLSTAAECIQRSEFMLSLMDSWNAEGAGIEYALISEFGLLDTDELIAFMDWVERSRIERALIFTGEIDPNGPYGQFTPLTLAVYHSDPLVKTARGEAFCTR